MKEDSCRVLPTIVDLIVVDFNVVAPLGRDNSWAAEKRSRLLQFLFFFCTCNRPAHEPRMGGDDARGQMGYREIETKQQNYQHSSASYEGFSSNRRKRTGHNPESGLVQNKRNKLVRYPTKKGSIAVHVQPHVVWCGREHCYIYAIVAAKSIRCLVDILCEIRCYRWTPK